MATKRIKDLNTAITAFRTGDVIPVDGPSGTAKMSKDDLLNETAENALGIIQTEGGKDTEFVWAVVDQNYKILVGVKSDGTLIFTSDGENTDIKKVITPIQTNLDSLNYKVYGTQDTEYAWAIVDKDNRILAGVKGDGTFTCFLDKNFLYEAEKNIIGSQKPENFCDAGNGTSSSPFESADGSAGLYQVIGSLTRGGCVKLSAKDYKITRSVKISQASTLLCGESMGYQGAPLGIHHGITGSVISLGNEDSHVIVGDGGGQEVTCFGIYGVEPNDYKTTMQNIFDPSRPLKNCGIEVVNSFDQGKISKICLALLGAGVVLDNGNFDASILDNINFDGCNTGFWCPVSGIGNYLIHSYFERNIFADMCGMAMYLRFLQQGFVKNNHISAIGAFISNAVASAVGYKCVMYVGGSSNIIDGNVFKNPGRVAKRIFGEGEGYYTDNTCKGLVAQSHYTSVINNKFYTPASTCITLKGNYGVVSNNVAYIDSGVYSGDVIVVEGNRNVVTGNNTSGETTSTSSLVINGDYNLVYGNRFTGKIVINGNNNKVVYNNAYGVEDNGTGNTIV